MAPWIHHWDTAHILDSSGGGHPHLPFPLATGLLVSSEILLYGYHKNKYLYK